MIFHDRSDAGRKLAECLADTGLTVEADNTVIVGLARGGVIVAGEIAKRFSLPLYSFSLNDYKIQNKETGKEMTVFLTAFDTAMIWESNTFEPTEFLENTDALFMKNQTIKLFHDKILAQHERFGGTSMEEISGKNVILVDDGAVSGHSIFAAVDAMLHAGAASIVIAIPAILKWFPATIRNKPVVTYRRSRSDNYATGMFYDTFADASDEEVLQELRMTESIAG